MSVNRIQYSLLNQQSPSAMPSWQGEGDLFNILNGYGSYSTFFKGLWCKQRERLCVGRQWAPSKVAVIMC